MEEAERLCDRVAIIEHGRLVDLGPPAALVDRHCPERSVVLVTADGSPADGSPADGSPADGSPAEVLERVPHLISLEREGSRFTLHGTGEEFVSDVIACLSEQRVRVTDFRTVLPSLEDVFLKLTGHSIRD
jgi:ABC-2 type transport system ATP-binding protein